MQIWAEPEKAALPICNYSQILYQFLTFTQNLKRSLYIIADDVAPFIVSIIAQFFLPMHKPLIVRSDALLSIGTSPSSRNTLRYFS